MSGVLIPKPPSGPSGVKRVLPMSTRRVESPRQGNRSPGLAYSPGPPPIRPIVSAVPASRSTNIKACPSRSDTNKRPSLSSRSPAIELNASGNAALGSESSSRADASPVWPDPLPSPPHPPMATTTAKEIQNCDKRSHFPSNIRTSLVALSRAPVNRSHSRWVQSITNRGR